ncbi:unnamed protein product, partial [Closterium sp. NIES-53]
SSLYTLAIKPPQVVASAQVSASGQVAPPCSCRLLSHQTLLWHHRLGHPSLPRLHGMHSRFLVSGLPRSLPPLPPSPSLLCLSCIEGRQLAAPHSSFPPTTAPLQTLHMDVWGPAHVSGKGRERYFLPPSSPISLSPPSPPIPSTLTTQPPLPIYPFPLSPCCNITHSSIMQSTYTHSPLISLPSPTTASSSLVSLSLTTPHPPPPPPPDFSPLTPSSSPPTHPSSHPPTHSSSHPPTHSSSLPPTHSSSRPPTHSSSPPPTHSSSSPPTHSSPPPTRLYHLK